MADRIQAGDRRCGELLSAEPAANGARTIRTYIRYPPVVIPDQAATEAGLSEHQRKTQPFGWPTYQPSSSRLRLRARLHSFLQSILVINTTPASRPRAIVIHPTAVPALRCLPERVRGIPIAREIRAFSAEIPIARFQLKDRPGIPVLLLRRDMNLYRQFLRASRRSSFTSTFNRR